MKMPNVDYPTQRLEAWEVVEVIDQEAVPWVILHVTVNGVSLGYAMPHRNARNMAAALNTAAPDPEGDG